MRIIGIDPGGTTGVVVVQPYAGEMLITETDHVTGERAPSWLSSVLSKSRVDTEIVIERFTISQRTLQGTRTGPLEALYAIGALRYVCDVHGLKPFFQTPAQVKNAYTDKTLRDLGLYGKVSGPHERDALRHALLHARTRGFWKGQVMFDDLV